MKWYPWLRPHFEQLINSYQAGRGASCVTDSGIAGDGG